MYCVTSKQGALAYMKDNGELTRQSKQNRAAIAAGMPTSETKSN